MKYSRLFLETVEITKNKPILLLKEQFHYIKNVMRLKNGSIIKIFNGLNGEWLGKIIDGSIIPENQIKEQKNSNSNNNHNNNAEINLCFALVKGNALKNIIRQATELGVHILQPIYTKYTIVKPIEKPNCSYYPEQYAGKEHEEGLSYNFEKLFDKFHIYAKEAAEQCERLTLPKILPPITFFKACENYKNIIICDETYDGNLAFEKEEPNKAQEKRKFSWLTLGHPYTVMIGPEGGFAPEELQYSLKMSNCSRISLGEYILRCDTAVVAAISYVKTCLEFARENPPFF